MKKIRLTAFLLPFAFIQAVKPHDVIFSAGHKYMHPRAVTAQRYVDLGIAVSHLFRTDRGDDEKGKEWMQTPMGAGSDSKGDDDVAMLITKDGQLSVAYRIN